MELIKTPFGDIDLDVVPISFFISDSSLGTRRKVQFEGIKSMTERGQFAQIVWLIWQYDQEGNLLNELDAVQGRQVITPVSGQNRVTAEGILIMREAFPEGEVGDRAYQMAFDKGYNEYQYWMALLRLAPLPVVLNAAGNLLAQYERYDRP
jgi:hypothetical protein